MHRWIKKIQVSLTLLVFAFFAETSLPVYAQTEVNNFDESLHLIEVENQLLSYYGELEQMMKKVSHISKKDLAQAERSLTCVGIKWNIYCQSVEFEISNSDSLLQLVTEFQLLKQGVSDSIHHKKAFFGALDAFEQARESILKKEATYKDMKEEAFKLSLTKATAEELEKLKQKEKLTFADIQKQYQTALDAVETCPVLTPRLKKLEQHFIELKSNSEKIQAAVYQSPLQRIKDYLYGLAAVAMILMFLNMLQTKYKAFKAKREQLKKMGNLFDNDQDYPTI